MHRSLCIFKADAEGTDRYAFFGVYDGHGGKLASEYVSKNLNLYLMQVSNHSTQNDLPIDSLPKFLHLIVGKE